jgi:N-acetylmuramoyl-L-alanine amidase
MARFPDAANHNIPPGPNDQPITPRIVVVHTMDGSIEGAEKRFTDGSGVEAHFGAAMDGRVWQWRDTSRQADAQAAGNDFCISVETEDAGDPNNRWTPIQFQRLVELISWIGRTHSIPIRLVTSTSERGIGFHRQFPEWNPNNHSCPGDVRLGQLNAELLPALQEDDMPLNDADKTWLKNEIRDAINDHADKLFRWADHGGGDPPTGSPPNHPHNHRAILDRLDVIEKQLK